MLDRAFGFLGILVFVEIGDRNVRALAGEQHRDRAADAGVGAGDERHHIEELFRAFVMRRVVHRLKLKLGFPSGLFQMLVGQRRRRIDTRAGLHGLGLLLLPLSVSLVGLVDLALNGAFLARGRLGSLLKAFRGGDCSRASILAHWFSSV